MMQWLAIALASTLTFPAIAIIDFPVDEEWASASRQLTTAWDPEGFQVTSERRSEAVSDAIDLAFDADQARLSIEFRADEPEQDRQRHVLSIAGLIEFRDLDGDGRFGLGDPQIQHIAVEGSLPATVHVESLSGGRYAASTTYRLPESAGGTFTVAVLAVPTRDAPEGPLQDPTMFRVGLRVDDFPFLAEEDSMLAVVLRWHETLELQDNALQTRSGDFVFVHDWMPSASAESRDARANVTVQAYATPDGPQSMVAFTYPRADAIRHDGDMGMQRINSNIDDVILHNIAGEWRFYIIGLVVAVAVIATPLVLRARQGT